MLKIIIFPRENAYAVNDKLLSSSFIFPLEVCYLIIPQLLLLNVLVNELKYKIYRNRQLLIFLEYSCQLKFSQYLSFPRY